MIYANKEFTKRQITMSFGALDCIEIGEQGRGRNLVLIPSPIDLMDGVNDKATIVMSKTGKPKIEARSDNKLFFVIDTAKGYTRRGNGGVYVSDLSKVKVLSRGNSADGDAGRIGTAMAYVLEVEGNVFLRIVMGGGYKSQVLYVTKDLRVLDFGINEGDNIAIASEHYGIDVPDYDGTFGDSWEDLR